MNAVCRSIVFIHPQDIQLSLNSCKGFSSGVVRFHCQMAKGAQGEKKGSQPSVISAVRSSGYPFFGFAAECEAAAMPRRNGIPKGIAR
jgi:hypothetical protein